MLQCRNSSVLEQASTALAWLCFTAYPVSGSPENLLGFVVSPLNKNRLKEGPNGGNFREPFRRKTEGVRPSFRPFANSWKSSTSDWSPSTMSHLTFFDVAALTEGCVSCVSGLDCSKQYLLHTTCCKGSISIKFNSSMTPIVQKDSKGCPIKKWTPPRFVERC